MFSPKTSNLVSWLTRVCPATLPSNVVAFNFNLAEGRDWVVELVGASSYDPDDDQWACPPEEWSSRPDELMLPRSVAGGTWQQAQAFVANGVTIFLRESNMPQAEVLRSADAVCVGFVDGSLERVWPQAEA